MIFESMTENGYWEHLKGRQVKKACESDRTKKRERNSRKRRRGEEKSVKIVTATHKKPAQTELDNHDKMEALVDGTAESLFALDWIPRQASRTEGFIQGDSQPKARKLRSGNPFAFKQRIDKFCPSR